MILPNKKIRPENSLIFIGGNILRSISEPKTISRVWHELSESTDVNDDKSNHKLTFDWFILSLDFLFLIGVLELSQGKVMRKHR